jgi:hypothetical protein
MTFPIFAALFFALPIASVVLLIISIVRYIVARKRNKAVPNTYSDAEIRNRKIMMIAMIIIAGVLVTIVISLMSLLLLAVAYM